MDSVVHHKRGGRVLYIDVIGEDLEDVLSGAPVEFLDRSHEFLYRVVHRGV